MPKAIDSKKTQSQIDILASDAYFFNQGDSFTKILDKVSNSLEFMKAVNEKRTTRSESVSKNIFIMQSLIEELLDRKLLIEDYIDIKKIRELTHENKLYKGITISPRIFDIINGISQRTANTEPV